MQHLSNACSSPNLPLAEEVLPLLVLLLALLLALPAAAAAAPALRALSRALSLGLGTAHLAMLTFLFRNKKIFFCK